MKKIYIILSFLFIFINANGQTFTLLANDPSGDNQMSFIADLKSISYTMDLVQDSIWFKVETYNAMDPNGDVGLMFGFDTNLVVTDGSIWNGGNASMGYDQSLMVFQNMMSPNYFGYTYNSLGSAPFNVDVQRPDSFTFIIRFQISLIDADGNFNLIFGSGGFDIVSTRTVYDDLPGTNYLSIASTTNIPEQSDVNFKVFPNPASSYMVVQSNHDMKYFESYAIYSLEGQLVFTGEMNDQKSIDISELSGGVYFLEVGGKGNLKILKFVKY